jgi:hypothetical protein
MIAKWPRYDINIKQPRRIGHIAYVLCFDSYVVYLYYHVIQCDYRRGSDW